MTALHWFLNQCIKKEGIDAEDVRIALFMEKDQIEDAYTEGYLDADSRQDMYKSPTHYYMAIYK